jgi:hypothetical protein
VEAGEKTLFAVVDSWILLQHLVVKRALDHVPSLATGESW